VISSREFSVACRRWIPTGQRIIGGAHTDLGHAVCLNYARRTDEGARIVSRPILTIFVARENASKFILRRM